MHADYTLSDQEMFLRGSCERTLLIPLSKQSPIAILLTKRNAAQSIYGRDVAIK